MGKNLIQQRRGKGSSRFRAPSFRYLGRVQHPKQVGEGTSGVIKDIVHCQGHTAPLIEVKVQNGTTLMIAPEGIKVGDELKFGKGAEIKPGNTLALADIPEGTPIHNIESIPGDGGKFVRSTGAFARIVSKLNDRALIKLPSKKEREFSLKCLATIGVVSGAGRPEKPFMKAGTKFFRMRATNRMWPSVSGNSMNAVDHPFGGKCSHRKGRPTQCGRNYPPGRKVGKVAPSRTGRRKI
jgi:large subunit ribosomal protein L2